MQGNKKIQIAFIGGGNMGEALIAAILRKKLFRAHQIGLSEPDSRRLKLLKRKFHVVSFSSNAELVRNASVLLLAVKPQQMSAVLEEIRPCLTKGHLVLSIAAGLDTAYFEKRLPPGTPLIRIMPNLCATIGEGAAAIYATPTTGRKEKALAMKIFSAAGKGVFVDREEWLDVVTALSGSGPAFVFLFIDSLIDAAEKLSLPAPLGRELTLQTLLGATRMIGLSKEPIQELILRVASRGGTTEAGLKALGELKFRETIREAIAASAQRARELRRMA